MIAQLQPAGPQGTQPPLRFGQRLPVVILEGIAILGGDAMGLAGLLGALQEAHGQ